MMRRLLGRLRTSRAGALYHRLDGTSEDDGRPWMTSFADARDEDAPRERAEIVAAERAGTVPEPDWEPVSQTAGEPVAETADAVPELDAASTARSEVETRSEFEAAPFDGAGTEADPGLVPALNRVADAFERMAERLEVEHRDREVRLAAVEQLLRELVTGLAQPTAVPPVVVGGSIDLEMLGGGAEDGPEAGPDGGSEIDLVDPPDDAVKKPVASRRTKRA
jgi:hypothetical protein